MDLLTKSALSKIRIPRLMDEERRDSVLIVLAHACVLGEAGAPLAVVSLPARVRPPQAAARRAGLEVRRESCNDRGPFS